MRHEIDTIQEQVRAVMPDVKIEQLKVLHPRVDDDGIWTFRREGKKEEVSLESSTGRAPFLVESTTSEQRFIASKVEEAIQAVQAFLVR
jgi:hypothetical protein